MDYPLLRPASSYEELWHQVDFATLGVPERFNLGVACTDDQDPAAPALTVVEPDRSRRDHTFGDVVDAANRLANALTGLGIGRGDRVGIVSAASFETAVAFMSRCSGWAPSRCRCRRCSGRTRCATGCATRARPPSSSPRRTQAGSARRSTTAGTPCRCW